MIEEYQITAYRVVCDECGVQRNEDSDGRIFLYRSEAEYAFDWYAGEFGDLCPRCRPTCASCPQPLFDGYSNEDGICGYCAGEWPRPFRLPAEVWKTFYDNMLKASMIGAYKSDVHKVHTVNFIKEDTSD